MPSRRIRESGESTMLAGDSVFAHPDMPDDVVDVLADEYAVLEARTVSREPVPSPVATVALPEDATTGMVDMEVQLACSDGDDAFDLYRFACEYAGTDVETPAVHTVTAPAPGLVSAEWKWPVDNFGPDPRVQMVERGTPRVTLRFRGEPYFVQPSGGSAPGRPWGVMTEPLVEFSEALVAEHTDAADEAGDADLTRRVTDGSTAKREVLPSRYDDEDDGDGDGDDAVGAAVFEEQTGAELESGDRADDGAIVITDDDDSASGGVVASSIPECPECGERDARQLSTGDWVCQECTHVWLV